MGYPAAALTERLDLRAIEDGSDVEALFAIFSDPAGWWYDPGRRHAQITTTEGWVARAAARWRDDGLSYWTVRLRGVPEIIGVGGAQRHRSAAWNLSYRLAAAHQGQGYATELSRAALDAAGSVDPDVPFIAWIDAHNAPSRRVAERVGLRNYGFRLDANDGQARLAYADREPGPLIAPPAPAPPAPAPEEPRG